MTRYELRLSNYNYDAGVFFSRVRDLLARDDDLLGAVVQRSAVIQTAAGAFQHLITKIDVLPKSVSAPVPDLLDYGTLAFTTEALTREALLTRLKGLLDRRFEAGQHSFTSASIGFSDRYEASGNPYSEWPCAVFDVAFGSTQLSHEPLFHTRLKTFASPFDAIRELLQLQNFNDSSDSRLGHIVLCIPNLNARLENLRIKGNRLQATVAGTAPPGTLKLDINYKNQTQSASIERRLDEADVAADLAFFPSELHVWLISLDGFIADFHDENEHYSIGGNSVLPKRKPSAYSPLPSDVRAEFSLLGTNGSARAQVFIIHGHNTSLKESVARFLKGLGLEPIILHEQPNRGATIIEKFEVHSDVAFAVALLTGDDEGKAAGGDVLNRRARQNVLFEFGFFVGKLGRQRVCALVETGLEIPSDYQGVVYIPADPSGRWKMELVRELKAAGLEVDANRAF